jgi:potassium efflux system protein
LIAVTVITITFITARNLPGFLHMAVLNRLPIDRGGRHAIAIICRYVTVLAGGIMACRTIGMTWSSVQWLAAAMTVGLGFGLQEIFANLVSGIIILFERPIRIGDLVTVSNTTGHVTRMQIRATTITDFDRRELVVPNKKFITDDVINWTLSDPITRVVIQVGVAYGSDTKLAHETLLKAAMDHPLVLREPGPSAVFTGFGASTLDFQLRYFIGSRDVYSKVLHELNTVIDKAFREVHLEIAFPQQDLHIRSAEPLIEALRGRGADRTNVEPTVKYDDNDELERAA